MRLTEVITLPSLEPNYHVEKAYEYKYMIPPDRYEIVHKDGTIVYYNTLRITKSHPDETYNKLINN